MPPSNTQVPQIFLQIFTHIRLYLGPRRALSLELSPVHVVLSGVIGKILVGRQTMFAKGDYCGKCKCCSDNDKKHFLFRCGYIGHTEAVHDVKDFKQVSNQQSNSIQAKLPSTRIMMCFHSYPCREEPLWTLLVGSPSRTGFTIRPLGAGGR